MGKVLISPNHMTDIADAVRTKVGSNEKLTASEMAAQILSISEGISLTVLASGYSSAKTYNVGDLVTRQDKLYVCTSDISVAESFNPSHWNETTISKEISAILSVGTADDKYY